MEFFTHAIKLLKMCESNKELDSVFADFQKYYDGLGFEFPGCYEIVKKCYAQEKKLYNAVEGFRKTKAHKV